jgi:ubiquitin
MKKPEKKPKKAKKKHSIAGVAGPIVISHTAVCKNGKCRGNS